MSKPKITCLICGKKIIKIHKNHDKSMRHQEHLENVYKIFKFNTYIHELLENKSSIIHDFKYKSLLELQMKSYNKKRIKFLYTVTKMPYDLINVILDYITYGDSEFIEYNSLKMSEDIIGFYQRKLIYRMYHNCGKEHTEFYQERLFLNIEEYGKIENKLFSKYRKTIRNMNKIIYKPVDYMELYYLSNKTTRRQIYVNFLNRVFKILSYEICDKIMDYCSNGISYNLSRNEVLNVFIEYYIFLRSEKHIYNRIPKRLHWCGLYKGQYGKVWFNDYFMNMGRMKVLIFMNNLSNVMYEKYELNQIQSNLCDVYYFQLN